MRWPLLALLPLLLGACATYQMGSTPKKQDLKDVRVIYVPTAQNETDETDLPGIMTNAILQEIDRDGTFRHARKDESDAILEVTIKKVERSAIRQSTEQFLTTLQFQLLVTVQYRLFNMKEKRMRFPTQPSSEPPLSSFKATKQNPSAKPIPSRLSTPLRL